jgi:hypothetical protein
VTERLLDAPRSHQWNSRVRRDAVLAVCADSIAGRQELESSYDRLRVRDVVTHPREFDGCEGWPIGRRCVVPNP